MTLWDGTRWVPKSAVTPPPSHRTERSTAPTALPGLAIGACSSSPHSHRRRSRRSTDREPGRQRPDGHVHRRRRPRRAGRASTGAASRPTRSTRSIGSVFPRRSGSSGRAPRARSTVTCASLATATDGSPCGHVLARRADERPSGQGRHAQARSHPEDGDSRSCASPVRRGQSPDARVAVDQLGARRRASPRRGARVSWSLDRPATGQVEFGTTTAYGRLTTARADVHSTRPTRSRSAASSPARCITSGSGPGRRGPPVDLDRLHVQTTLDNGTDPTAPPASDRHAGPDGHAGPTATDPIRRPRRPRRRDPDPRAHPRPHAHPHADDSAGRDRGPGVDRRDRVE